MNTLAMPLLHCQEVTDFGQRAFRVDFNAVKAETQRDILAYSIGNRLRG
jgi:hypothetical protein